MFLDTITPSCSSPPTSCGGDSKGSCCNSTDCCDGCGACGNCHGVGSAAPGGCDSCWCGCCRSSSFSLSICIDWTPSSLSPHHTPSLLQFSTTMFLDTITPLCPSPPTSSGGDRRASGCGASDGCGGSGSGGCGGVSCSAASASSSNLPDSGWSALLRRFRGKCLVWGHSDVNSSPFTVHDSLDCSHRPYGAKKKYI